MRISFNHMNHVYHNHMNQGRPGPAAAGQKGRPYDEITIKSPSPQAAENQFLAQVTRSLSEEIRNAPTPYAKIESLQAKIQQGTYQVDADAISSRILLWKGSTSHG